MNAIEDNPLYSIPKLDLDYSSIEQYCQSIEKCRYNEFWWYFNKIALWKGFSKPFKDKNGKWHYCVKPGFSWPVDFTENLKSIRFGLDKTFIGYQVPSSDYNSKIYFNFIQNIIDYDIRKLNRGRKSCIKKGLANLEIKKIGKITNAIIEDSLSVWNNHVKHTGWNKKLKKDYLKNSWVELMSVPGSNIIVASDKESNQMCGFLIGKLIGKTAFIDTVASHHSMLSNHPNDALIYSFIKNSALIPSINNCCYSLKGEINSLESFKKSIGFTQLAFHCKTYLRFPHSILIRYFKPSIYNRIYGLK